MQKGHKSNLPTPDGKLTESRHYRMLKNPNPTKSRPGSWGGHLAQLIGGQRAIQTSFPNLNPNQICPIPSLHVH